MKTGKKLLSLILVLALALSLTITSSAEEEIIADVYDLDNNLIESVTRVDDLVNKLASGYEDNVFILKSDITVPIKEASGTAYAILDLNIAGLDLNWHTIKVTGNVSTEAQLIYLIPVSQTSQIEFIKNGSIVFDCTLPKSADYVAGIYLLRQGPLVLENLELVADESSNLKVGILGGGFEHVDDHLLKNCVVDVGGQAVGTQNTGEWTMKLESGSYTNMPSDENSNIIISGSPHTDINGVDEGTTVVTSTATTAMIVKDGNAYLYDTLQDAVDAVDADDTIQLLKQPEDEKVIVPDNLQFSIKAFDNSEVSTDSINLETSDGKQVIIDENGTVEVVDIPATGITLDKTSAEVFSGETVTLTATVTPANTTDTVTWSTSDSNVATVANGVVTGKSHGTATITATAGDMTAKCTVTVDPSWKVMLDNELKEVLKGQPFTFPAAPTKPGYIFMGWRGVDGVTYQPGDEVAITGDTSFKAIWANMPDITPGTPDEPDDEPDVDVFPFYDVSAGAWYYDAVKYAWEHELMNGVSATEFSPNTTLNRAMIWTMLARLDGVNTDGGASWYAKAQEWAVSEGVSDGTDPMGAVTREQLVTMLWRFKGEPAVDFLLTAKDAGEVSSWAYEAMRWAVAEGIIEGDENGLITPTATATRAQAAAIFMRFIEG